MKNTAPARTHSITRLIGGVGAAAALIMGLVGCTASANLTVPADGIADLAASALSDQWGSDATVDCGDDSVDAVVDTQVECIAHNPNSGLEYPATVTITEVDGSNISISVTTGNAIAPEGEEPAGLTTSPEQIEQLAAGALAGQFGFEPVMDCGSDPITVEVDAEISCTSTHENGFTYPATVTITEVEGTSFSINVSQGVEPID